MLNQGLIEGLTRLCMFRKIVFRKTGRSRGKRVGPSLEEH